MGMAWRLCADLFCYRCADTHPRRDDMEELSTESRYNQVAWGAQCVACGGRWKGRHGWEWVRGVDALRSAVYQTASSRLSAVKARVRRRT